MNANRIALRVFASPRFAAAVIAGIGTLCIAALDVPQGLADREVLEAWSHGAGPYVAVLGLNHLGRGLLPWALLALLAAHAAAVRLTAPAPMPRLDRWSVTGIVVLALALAGFAATGFTGVAPDVRDATRLAIEPVLDAAPGGRQVVEEGAAYQLPGIGGDRVVSFGVTSLGPWAAERRADGRLVAHLPVASDAETPKDVTFRVDARRPRAVSAAAESPTLPASIPAAASLLAALAAAVLLLVVGSRSSALRGIDRGAASAWLAATILFTLVNPLAGPGRAEVPVGAGALGAPVLDAVLARTPLDVSTWVGSFPAVTVLAPLRAVLWVAAVALVLVVLVRLSRPKAEGPVRLATRVAGALAIAGGAVLLAWAMGRIPLPDTVGDLAARFSRDVLPRLPASLSVFEAAPTQAGPYVLPVSWGLLAAVGPLAAGVALVASQGSRPILASLPFEPFALALVVLGLARAASLAFAPAIVYAPPGAVPIAAASAVLAAASLLARRLHPGHDLRALVPAMVAAGLQLALAA